MSQVEPLPTTESKRRAILPLLAWPRFVALAYATPLLAETRCAGDAGPGKPKLTVQVDGVRNLQGQVAITIYPDDRRRFMARGGKLLRTRVPVSSLKIRACFWLPKGTYAVVVYHDEDGDGGFDRTALGLPKEGYGFSNDAPARAGLPSFESVRFKHEGASSLSIRMRYGGL